MNKDWDYFLVFANSSKKSLSSVCRSITSVYQRDDDIRMQELILKLFHSQTA